jgi:hypothetical protein
MVEDLQQNYVKRSQIITFVIGFLYPVIEKECYVDSNGASQVIARFSSKDYLKECAGSLFSDSPFDELTALASVQLPALCLAFDNMKGVILPPSSKGKYGKKKKGGAMSPISVASQSPSKSIRSKKESKQVMGNLPEKRTLPRISVIERKEDLDSVAPKPPPETESDKEEDNSFSYTLAKPSTPEDNEDNQKPASKPDETTTNSTLDKEYQDSDSEHSASKENKEKKTEEVSKPKTKMSCIAVKAMKKRTKASKLSASSVSKKRKKNTGTQISWVSKRQVTTLVTKLPNVNSKGKRKNTVDDDTEEDKVKHESKEDDEENEDEVNEDSEDADNSDVFVAENSSDGKLPRPKRKIIITEVDNDDSFVAVTAAPSRKPLFDLSTEDLLAMEHLRIRKQTVLTVPDSPSKAMC